MKTQNKKSRQKVAPHSNVTQTAGVQGNNRINSVMSFDDTVEEAKNWVDFNEL